MKLTYRLILLMAMSFAGLAYAADELVSTAHYANGENINYILTTETQSPKYVTILMPGGVGRLEPTMDEGRLKFMAAGNFLIRSRALFAGDDFAAVSADSTGSPERMQAILDDIHARFPAAQIYIIGTSSSTYSTMRLSGPLDGKVAGFVHSSSMDGINSFDTRRFTSRHLLVYHRDDSCRSTSPRSAIYAHEKYGTDILMMEGGKSVGESCEAFAHHGYNGIERETVERIKAWIREVR